MGQNGIDLTQLVREDGIHQSVYTDPAIFALEIEKIFKKVWLYIGHESQVKNPGDFITLDLIGQPLVMCRHRDGTVHVLFNRCGHRAAKVVNEASGNTRTFTCCYHGWSFSTDGSVSGVPQREDYPEALDFSDPKLGMGNLPRVQSYHGFVFGSFSAEGPDLESWLGPAKIGFDELVALSPEDKVDLSGGCHRYHYRGNWKHQFENLADTYHPNAAHVSTVDTDGLQFKRQPGATGGRAPFFDKKGVPLVSKIGIWAFPNGHTSEGTMFTHEAQSGPLWEEYKQVLAKRRGLEQAAEILRQKRHSLAIYPSMDILMAQHSIRVTRPIAVDRTEVIIYPVRMVGAPEGVFREIVRFVNITHSASSFVQTDDLESFTRCQIGTKAGGSEWCVLARGLTQEQRDNHGVMFGDRASEIGQRNQHKFWLSLMTA